MTKDIALALICFVGFVVFLARAERQVPRIEQIANWSYSTSTFRYVNPHGFTQRWHNLATELGLRDVHTYFRTNR